jgi:hypothetical protein
MVVVLHSSLQAGDAFIERAETAAEIVEWAESHYGAVPHYEFEDNGKRCLILMPDVGSGVTLRMVLIYVSESSGWSLVMVRKTNTSAVTVERKGDELVFYTRLGRVLMIVPIGSMSREFNAKEQ